MRDAIEQALRYESGGTYDIRYTIINQLDGKERIVRAKGRAWFDEEHVAYRLNWSLQNVRGSETAGLRHHRHYGQWDRF